MCWPAGSASRRGWPPSRAGRWIAPRPGCWPPRSGGGPLSTGAPRGQRVEAWVAAQQVRALDRTRTRLLATAVREETTIDGCTPWTAVHRQVETEISTALRWTSRFTIHRLDTAETLTDKLPHALDALAAGQLSYRHADMICDETITLTDLQARRLVDRLLPEASSKTVGGLRRRLRKAVLALD